MLKPLCVLCLALMAAALTPEALRGEVRQVTLPDEYQSVVLRPITWDGGYFLVTPIDPKAGEPQVFVHQSDGSLLYEATVTLPDAAAVSVKAAAVLDTDGALVISIHSWSRAAQSAAMLGFIDKTGHLLRIVRTNPFLAVRLRAAPDGSVWALGWDFEHGAGTSGAEVLRHYSSTGELLGAFLPRGQFPRESHPSFSSGELGSPQLEVTADRVDLLLPGPRLWVQTDHQGHVLQRVSLAFKKQPDGALQTAALLSAGLAPDGRILSWMQGGAGTGASGYYTLDSAGIWRPLAFNASRSGRWGLVGINANSALVRSQRDGMHKLAFEWVALDEVLR